MKRSMMVAVLLFGSSLFPAAQAGDAPAEAALANAWKDAKLQWGPCPAFIPAGCQIAVLHGDPSKPNADVFFKVPAGFAIPEHWHTSAERMTLVSGELSVAYQGHAAVTLKKGMYAYGPAKVAHKATCSKGEPCVLFIAFEAPVDAFPTEKAAP